MTKLEASRLVLGSHVVAANGKYIQQAVVANVEPHHREGLWITFCWRSPGGVVRIAKKRHCSVYLPEEGEAGPDYPKSLLEEARQIYPGFFTNSKISVDTPP